MLCGDCGLTQFFVYLPGIVMDETAWMNGAAMLYLDDKLMPQVWACPQCDFSSRQESDLREHLAFHFADLQYACEVCSFSHLRKDVLKEHSDLHHLSLRGSQWKMVHMVTLSVSFIH